MTILLGIVASLLTLAVAIYSATQEKLPAPYRAMIWAAAIATIVQSVWSAAEQRTFEKRVLGGDSYVYLTFEGLDETSSKFLLNHGGEKYPVYDVFVELYDMRKFSGVNTRDPREFAKRMQRIERNVFGPSMVTSMLNNFHPADCYGYWMAVVQQRNGPVMNVIRAKKINGKWESATRVFSLGDGQTLIKEYPSSGWTSGSEWPVVTARAVGSFSFKTPRISCSGEANS